MDLTDNPPSAETSGSDEKTWIKQELRKMDTDQDSLVEDRKELVEVLFEKAEAYAKTNIELYKLRTVDKLAVVIASLVSRILVIIIFSFFFLMLNVGIAIWLGESMGHLYYGFFIVSGLYAVIALLLFALRNTIIKHPIINSMISQVLK